MELYLLRHAIAADYGPAGTGDAGRPLTPEGTAKMQKAAAGLRRIGLQPQVLLSSPFVRAAQTAAIVAEALDMRVQLADELASGCTLERLLPVLEQHHSAASVMIVGHEPDLSTIVEELTGGSIEMKKGALALVELDLPVGAGVLRWLLPPKVLRAMAG